MDVLKRSRTGCFTVACDKAGNPVSALIDKRGLFPDSEAVMTMNCLLAGEYLFELPGAMAVASGYPVSSASPGLNGQNALRAVVERLARGEFARLAEFDGPFLVLVWRENEREIIVARDKFGIRPALYRADGRNLAVADDPGVLAECRGAVRGAGLAEWMHYGKPLEPLSLFAGLRTLPAGSVLVFSPATGACRIERYFSPMQCVSAEQYARLGHLPFAELKRRVAEEFDHAVAASVAGRDRVSIMLSGGVDSSLLAAHARRHAAVSAFTLDIQGTGAESEYIYAKEAADALGIELTPLAFGPRQFILAYCTAVQSLGSPVITESAIALHHAAESGALPRGQLVLDGEGADDLLGGSTGEFKYSLSMYLWRQLPLLGKLPARTGVERLRRLLGRIGLATRSALDDRGLDVDLGARRAEITHFDTQAAAALAHVYPQEARDICKTLLRGLDHGMASIVQGIDAMCSRAGTHAYLPYLAGGIFSLLQNLPLETRIRWDFPRLKPVTKFITKELLAEHLSPRFVHRPKMGFAIPVWKWMRMPGDWCRDSWVAEHFGLSRPALDECLKRHGNSSDLMFFTSMEIWGRLFERRLPLEQVQAEWIAGQLPETVAVHFTSVEGEWVPAGANPAVAAATEVEETPAGLIGA